MKFRFGFIAMVLLMCSCSIFSDPQSELILNVENEFEIEMVEMLDPSERALGIKITLLEQLNCQESTLELTQSNTYNDLNIVIDNIILPENCDNQVSYPEGAATFQVSNKAYNINIQVKEQVNQNGTLQVTSKGYILDLSNAKGLIVSTPEILKIPNRFVWGYFQGSDSTEIEYIESFLLQNDYSTRPLTNMSPGNYSYFEIDEEGNVHIKDMPSTGIVKPLAFDLADLNEIKEVVSNFKASHPDIGLVLYGSDGSTF